MIWQFYSLPLTDVLKVRVVCCLSWILSFKITTEIFRTQSQCLKDLFKVVIKLLIQRMLILINNLFVAITIINFQELIPLLDILRLKLLYARKEPSAI